MMKLTCFYSAALTGGSGPERESGKGGLDHMDILGLMAVLSFGLTCFGIDEPYQIQHTPSALVIITPAGGKTKKKIKTE